MIAAPAGIRAQYEATDGHGMYIDGHDLLEAQVVAFQDDVIGETYGYALILLDDGTLRDARRHRPTRPAAGDADGDVPYLFVGLVGDPVDARKRRDQ